MEVKKLIDKQLEFRTARELTLNWAVIRPGVDRMVYLDQFWLCPDSLKQYIEWFLLKKGTPNDLAKELLSVLNQKLKNDKTNFLEETIDKFPIEVNQELIRELKRKGHYLEAANLLEAYYASKEKNKKELQKENRNIYNKIWLIKNKLYGVKNENKSI